MSESSRRATVASPKTPDLDAGEEITRKLAFGYPEGIFPERLICFGNEIPLKRK